MHNERTIQDKRNETIVSKAVINISSIAVFISRLKLVVKITNVLLSID